MQAFSRQTLEFLFENRMQDSKAWFEEHRAVYQAAVLAPLHDLVEGLAPVMSQIDPRLTTEPRVGKTISRIRRDTRFSRDKSLYRDQMWIIFKRGQMHGAELPGLYVEITQHGFSYGCGFYHAAPSYLAVMRSRILRGDPLFAAAQAALAGQSPFRLEGDCYKRARFPGQPEELRNWLERRELTVSANSRDFSLLFSDRLLPRLRQDFPLLAPVYRFLLETALEHQHPPLS